MTDSTLLPSVPALTGSASLPLLLLGLLLVYCAGLLRRGAQLGQRWGVRYSSRARVWAEWARICGVVLALSGLGRWAASRVAPFTALWLSVGVFALFAVTGTLRDIAGVLLVRLRHRLVVADHLRIGALQGELSSMHWDHLALRGRDGERLVVPGRALLRARLGVQPRRQGLRLACSAQGELAPEALARLGDSLAICVYRVPNTPMRVHAQAGVVHVSLHVWSSACVEAAEQLVHDKLRELSRRDANSQRPSAASSSVPPSAF